MTQPFVMVALSGGVDSAVVARLLSEKYEKIVGVSHKHWPESRCCSTSCLDRCAAQCQDMGIPYYPVDCMVEFTQAIVDDFVATYQQGRTPNPCVLCNQTIRFDMMIQKFFAMNPELSDLDYRIATGHYAQIEKVDGKAILKRGVDLDKDQSYMLYRLSEKQLQKCLFPLGKFYKSEVREKAENWQLRSSKQSDSQDVCFVTSTYQKFLDDYVGKQQKPGELVDRDGKVLGEHRGVAYYTRGQRKGLGLSGGPWYVIEVDTVKNEIVLGPREDLSQKTFILYKTEWGALPIKFPFQAKVQLRYHGKVMDVFVEKLGSEDLYKCHLDEFSYDITPGQSAVIYEKDYVVGGGLITDDLP
ncbi:tRNA 2-thiouridine(34) synthase MnmA [PVC group bacterium (ex Bugula neritina AB1)]|nr:tRNA 2-thiouridine(34) synthase MnmA [PVC group bacterium (ex Bugula neritina AB1)]